MASINTRNGKLQIDFRYKKQRCREQTRYVDTPAGIQKATAGLVSCEVLNFEVLSPALQLFEKE